VIAISGPSILLRFAASSASLAHEAPENDPVSKIRVAPFRSFACLGIVQSEIARHG
jgi:hypothetical protein